MTVHRFIAAIGGHLEYANFAHFEVDPTVHFY